MNDLRPECTVATSGRVVRTRAPWALSMALALGVLLGYAPRGFTAVEIEVAPPPPRVIESPPPRPGFIWAPGYWAWNGHQHVWREGHWIPERHGYRWVADRWDERRHGHWHYVPGHWER